ncbi:MAG: DUF2029 domain-containing protein [Planctomycetes bacterium]|nr:DUF2029 domain-containing protein [Planctomycetota bacterium]
MSKQKHWIYWPSIILATWVGLFLIYGWKSTQYMLDLYSEAASTMLVGESAHGIAAMAYPPPLVALYIPFVYLGESIQRVAMLGVMSCILVFIFSTIQSMIVGKKPLKSTIIFWCTVALVVGRYVTSPVENYSHDIVIAGFVFLAIRLWANQKEGTGGAVMGVAAACKATPLLFFPFLLLQRRWKAAIVMGIVTVIVFKIPDYLFTKNVGSWSGYWFSLVTNSLNQVEGTTKVSNWTVWNQLNQSLAGTIVRLFSTPTISNKDAVDIHLIVLQPQTIKWIIFVSRVAILGILVAALYKRPQVPMKMRRFCEGAMIVCGMLLLSPMSSKAHFFLLLLPAVLMVRFFIWEHRDWIIGSILIVMFVYGTLSVKDLIGKEAGHAVLATGSVTWCTLLAMLGTWRVMWVHQSSLDSS